MDNIKENNDLIERFMGGFHEKMVIHASTYHESWDQLMPVVGKIENSHENIDVLFYPQGCAITRSRDTLESKVQFSYCTDEDTKIEAVYKAVVEFIKWHNKEVAKDGKNTDG